MTKEEILKIKNDNAEWLASLGVAYGISWDNVTHEPCLYIMTNGQDVSVCHTIREKLVDIPIKFVISGKAELQ